MRRNLLRTPSSGGPEGPLVYLENAMRYADGSLVTLGDLVFIGLADGSAKARVVMLGETGEHLISDQQFVDWVKRENLLKPEQVVVEWLDANPFAQADPKYGPVGNYMFTGLDCCVKRVE